MKFFVAFFCLLAAASSLAQSDKVATKSVGTKAASTVNNNFCQCDDYAWTDKNGYKQGNCAS